MTDDFTRRMLADLDRQNKLMDPYRDLRPFMGPLDDIRRASGLDAFKDPLASERAQIDRMLEHVRATDQTALGLQRELIEGRSWFDRHVEEARRADPMSYTLGSLGMSPEARQAYGMEFRFPELNEAHRLAQMSATEASIARLITGTDSVEEAMRKMRNPWLHGTDGTTSALAMAQLLGIGQSVDRLTPFDAGLAEALRPSLGDWRDMVMPSDSVLLDPVLRSGLYRERGFDPTLIDFTPAAFHESLALAGLREPVRGGHDESAPADGDADTSGFEVARAAYCTLFDFEVAVRLFIAQRMEAAFGPKWMKGQLPNNMLTDWTEKKTKAIAGGAAEAPLIDFADFTDYIRIIERTDNWRVVFKDVFGRVEDVRESFFRLGPVRIATMHARPIVQSDELLLAVESYRVLKAIRGATT
jgi:hypothetical protein